MGRGRKRERGRPECNVPMASNWRRMKRRRGLLSSLLMIGFLEGVVARHCRQSAEERSILPPPPFFSLTHPFVFTPPPPQVFFSYTYNISSLPSKKEHLLFVNPVLTWKDDLKNRDEFLKKCDKGDTHTHTLVVKWDWQRWNESLS